MAMSKEKRKQFAVTTLLINLFSCLTVVFFSPMEVVLINQHEFYFAFLNAALFQLVAALAAAGLATLVMVYLPSRAGILLAGMSLGGGIAAYVQALFLNGSMVAMTGKSMEVSGTTKAVNLIIWIALIAAAVLLLWRQRKPVITAVRCVAAALIVMQGAAMIGSITTNGIAEKGDALFLTAESQFEFSSGNNVIEIVLDTTDGTVVREMLERYPELYDSLAGWVYYPNATSKNSRTYPSLPYMLTGKECFYDRPAEEYVQEAFDSSPFLPGLKEAGTDICLYTTDTDIIGNSAAAYTRNSLLYDYSQLNNLDPVQLVKNLMHVGLYKSMPYVLKEKFSYKTGIINISSFRGFEKRAYRFREEDAMFYQDFQAAGGLSVSSEYSKAYRLYHLFGNHPGYMWDQNMEITTGADQPDALRGSFRIIEMLISEMKRLGIYDDATIIVTADHGMSNLGGKTLEIEQTYCPLLMVKYPKQNETEPMQINEAPVAHDDLFATIEDALGAKRTGCGSGKSLNEFSAGDERERIYYYTAFYDNKEGEIVLREYQVSGNAEDIRNWHLTGRWWDVQYSRHKVAQRRFAEITGEP